MSSVLDILPAELWHEIIWHAARCPVGATGVWGLQRNSEHAMAMHLQQPEPWDFWVWQNLVRALGRYSLVCKDWLVAVRWGTVLQRVRLARWRAHPGIRTSLLCSDTAALQARTSPWRAKTLTMLVCLTRALYNDDLGDDELETVSQLLFFRLVRGPGFARRFGLCATTVDVDTRRPTAGFLVNPYRAWARDSIRVSYIWQGGNEGWVQEVREQALTAVLHRWQEDCALVAEAQGSDVWKKRPREQEQEEEAGPPSKKACTTQTPPMVKET